MKPCKNKNCFCYQDDGMAGCNYYNIRQLEECDIYQRLYMPKEKDLQEMLDGAKSDFFKKGDLKPTFDFLQEIKYRLGG